MRYISIIFILFTSLIGKCQDKRVQLCFDILRKEKSINNSRVKKADLHRLKVEITYFNFGDTVIFIDSTPLIGRDYANSIIYDDLGNNSIIIRLFKKNGSHFEAFLSNKPHPYIPSKKEIKTLKKVAPGSNYTINRGLYTNYFESLPSGEYEVSLDYVDEIKTIDNNPQNIDSAIFKKYYDGNSPSSGYYIQFSKNTIKFTVVD